jgi:hypothetical protein
MVDVFDLFGEIDVINLGNEKSYSNKKIQIRQSSFYCAVFFFFQRQNLFFFLIDVFSLFIFFRHISTANSNKSNCQITAHSASFFSSNLF